MRVFISWSGPESKSVAHALRDWLPLIIQAIDPWVSVQDIDKGEQWFTAIQKSLSDAKGMGIFCLTKDNIGAPWLAFEAGALGAHEQGRVATFLYGVRPEAVKPPLSLFQATISSDKDDVLKLLNGMNQRLEKPLRDELLARTFDTHWENFSKSLNEIQTQILPKAVPKRSTEDLLEEILNTVRRLEKGQPSNSDAVRRLRELQNLGFDPSSAASVAATLGVKGLLADDDVGSVESTSKVKNNLLLAELLRLDALKKLPPGEKK